MKKWIVLSLVAILLLSGTGYAVARYHQRQEWKAAYADALDAFNRAYQYKDAGTLLYEPRLKDFETANDRLLRLSQSDSYAQHDAEMLHLCGSNLDSYRSEMQHESEALRLEREGLKGVSHFTGSMQETDKELQNCLAKR